MLRVILLLGIYTITVFSTCSKGIRFDCAETKYAFESAIKIYPDTDSINIGDTIWLESVCPTKLKDSDSGSIIDYSGAENFGISIRFFRMIGGSVSDPGIVAAVPSFDYVLKFGTFLPDDHLSDEDRDYKFAETNNEYRLKLGIVPKVAGTYLIGSGNSANVYRRSDKCTKASFNIEFVNTNQHFYFLEQNRPGYILTQYDLTHNYCFKVK